jgi:beta-galactosidase GanA
MNEANLQVAAEPSAAAKGFPLGVQYYGPPHTGPDDWNRDFPLIKEHGLDAIAVWAIWGHIETSPGSYDFAAWDQMFDAAQAHGLKIMPVTTIEIQPYWIHRQFPHAHMLDQRGATIQSTTGEYVGGISPGACLDHAEPREAASRYLTALAAHFKDRENLLGWDAWNELRWIDNIDDHALKTSKRLACYCDQTVARFRDWLKAKYGSLEGVNARWRHHYTDWADVYPPRSGWWSYGYPETVDWNEFRIANLVDKLQMRVSALRKGDPNHLIINHTGSASIRSSEMLCDVASDDFKNAGVVDAYATSLYPAWGSAAKTRGELNCIGLDAIRSAVLPRGKQFWISELQGGPSLHSPGKGNNYSPQDLKFWTYCSLAHGAKGILYWSWRPEPFGPETLGFGITTFGGIPTPRTAMVKEVSQTIQRSATLLSSAQPYPAQVAILFDPDTYIINHYGGTGGMEPGMMVDSMHGYYKALWENDIPVDFLHADDIERLSNYRLLILPFAFILREKVAAAIQKFVRSGGVVLAEAYLGRYAEGCVPALTCPTYGLHELFQVQTLEAGFIEAAPIRPTAPGDLFQDGAVLTGLWFKEQVRLLEGAEVLATFEDGTPALTRSCVGAGQALFFGALMGYGYHQAHDRSLADFIANLAKVAGVSRPAHISGSDQALLRAHLLSCGADTLVFCMNYGPDCAVRLDLDLPAPVEIRDLESGAALPFTRQDSGTSLDLDLAFHEARVFLYKM